MAEKSKRDNTHVHLTKLIQCSRFKGEAPEYVLKRGRRVHEKVEARLKVQYPQGMAEAHLQWFTPYGVVHFTPDFVTPYGSKILVIEIKGSRAPTTLSIGVLQLCAYISLLAHITGKQVIGELKSVDPDTGSENFTVHIQCPKRVQKRLIEWLKKRLKQKVRDPPMPLACQYCIYNNKCINKRYDKPPGLDLMLRSLSKTRSVLDFLG